MLNGYIDNSYIFYNTMGLIYNVLEEQLWNEITSDNMRDLDEPYEALEEYLYSLYY